MAVAPRRLRLCLAPPDCYQGGMDDIPAFLSVMSVWDAVAAAYLFIAWTATGWYIESRIGDETSTGGLMAQYRRAWFREASLRDARIVDATLLSSLRNGTAFFASASLAALGAAVALLGQTDELSHVATDLAAQLSAPKAAWILKLLGVIAILASGFLNFVWSHRVFGYCAVLLGAMPNDVDSPEREEMAAKAADLNIVATKSFNRGLRAIYFALAALAWLIGAWMLILSVTLTSAMLFEREFRSTTRKILLRK
jgi:uncharacterized membrane protein